MGKIQNYSKFFLIMLALACSHCSASSSDSSGTSLSDTANNKALMERTSTDLRDTNADTASEVANIIADTLTKSEQDALNTLLKENEFILYSNRVMRYYSKQGELLESQLMISTDSLSKKGYISYELIFYKNSMDNSIVYNYNMGQASIGFGSAVFNSQQDYLHTWKSCGITACITVVYEGGKKVLEETSNN